VHVTLAANRNLDDTGLCLALLIEDLFQRSSIELSFFGHLAAKMRCRLRLLGANLLDSVPDPLDGNGQLLRIALTGDVHEVDLWLIEKEVVMQGCYLQPARERGVHRRGNFILENDGVAHDHGAVRRW